MTGFWDGTFRPENKITRVEFLKLIFLVKNITLSDDSKNYFSDIKDGFWHKKYVNTAINLWIVSVSNKNFNPNSNISKAESLKMAIMLFVWNIDNKYSLDFLDVKEWDWFWKYVDYAVKNNLIAYSWKYFYPNNFISRREVVWILYVLSWYWK